MLGGRPAESSRPWGRAQRMLGIQQWLADVGGHRATGPSTKGGNEVDCLINEPGGGKSPHETTTLDDISCLLCKTLAQQTNRNNSFVATRRVF